MNGKCWVILLFGFVLLIILSGCKPENPQTTAYHADKLEIDERYGQTLEFTSLDIQIPLDDPHQFVRIDPPVRDMNAHQQAILKSLSIPLERCRFHYSSDPNTTVGRTMHLKFKDGKECAFIWVSKNENDILLDACLNHEKYHALCRLTPARIDDLSNHMHTLGFSVNLRDYDEEAAATLIQVLTIHLSGVDLEAISGSAHIVTARDELLRVKPTDAGGEQGERTQ